MPGSDLLLTVFTPAYNRAHTLPRLHDSLLAQTDMDFEWLVVDDGSIDGTGDLVLGWAGDSPFPVRYLWQENSGKHVAHNLAAREAHGRLFICVDSDDWLEPDAVATVRRDSEQLSVGEGIIYPKLFSSQDELGNKWFPAGVAKIEFSDMGMKFGLVVETAIVFDTEVLLRHPFPVISGEKYIPEGSAYREFISPELFLVRDDCFYRCEYLQDGLTKNMWRNRYRNPVGTKIALRKGYEAARRYRGKYALRGRVASICGIESLNMALHVPLFDGLPDDSPIFERVTCMPIARILYSKRYGFVKSFESDEVQVK